jgi:hypothetical protein
MDDFGTVEACRIGVEERAALGAVALATHDLDEWIGYAIEEVAAPGSRNAPRNRRAPLGVKIKCLDDAVSAVLEERKSPAICDWRALVDRLTALAEDRNHFVHSKWAFEGTFGELVARKAQAAGEPIVRPVAIEELHAIALRAQTLREEVLVAVLVLTGQVRRV